MTQEPYLYNTWNSKEMLMAEDYASGNICTNDGSWEGMLRVLHIYALISLGDESICRIIKNDWHITLQQRMLTFYCVVFGWFE